jgi:hypothetical protein
MKCCNHISLNKSVLYDVKPCCLIYTRMTEELAASVLYLIHRPSYHRHSSNLRRCFSLHSHRLEKPSNTSYHTYYGRNMLLSFMWKSIPLSFCLEIKIREHLLFRILAYLFKVNFSVLWNQDSFSIQATRLYMFMLVDAYSLTSKNKLSVWHPYETWSTFALKR